MSIKTDHQNSDPVKRMLAVVLTAAMIAACFPFAVHEGAASAASVTAKGTVNDNDVNLRADASVLSKSLGTFHKNTKVTISSETFTAKKSTAATKRWYKVKAKGKTGYIRADLISNISYGSTQAVTTAALNYRKGPATTFKILGTAAKGTAVTLLLPAGRSGKGSGWYKASVGGTTAYICAKYVRLDTSASSGEAAKVDLSGKSKLAKALLTNPTNGGKARVVYTFNSSNCKKRFKVKGYKNNWVPQGMAYTGNQYYIIFGMDAYQGIVTYSASGKRLSQSKFPFCMKHPNGITWDPLTGLCYIFRGNQTRIYTWNPVTNKYGKSRTPYSSSGIAFDSSAGTLYATSRTGIRQYSADGKFTHLKLFSRCSRSGTHYIQDCGAGQGFIFHGVSGANKHTTNFLDVYRAADNKYLGSIRVKLGELESVIVTDDGYVELLINHSSTHNEYIWRTPLNVNELKTK